MRKTWKRALSLVLSAALVVTAGAFGTVQGDKSAKAADGINFNAFFECFGGFWGWDVSKPTTPGAWSVNVTDYGDYTVKMTAETDWDFSGAFVVNTDLTSVPANFKLVGKSVKIGSTTYDWSKATSYLDGTNVRLSIWNEWGKDDEGKWDPKGNPLADDPTTLSIKKGDEIEATFSVVEQKPLFNAYFESFGGFWGWDASKPVTPGAWSVAVTDMGDYSVEMTADTDWDFSGAFVVNTDLTALPTDYEIVPKEVEIGSTKYDWSKATPYLDGTNVRMSIWNEWGKDEEGNWDAKANPLVSDPTTLSIKKGDKLKATFTVKTKGGAVTTPPTQKPGGNTPAPKETTKVNGLAKGKTFSAGSLKYKVTKAATITTIKKTKKNGTVQVVGFSKSGKKKTSINVKNTVTRKGVKYNVTSVKSKAFQKSKKLKKATLGSKITSIPTSAFSADKKLTSVKATGVKKIGKSAFKSCVKLNKLTLGKKKLSSVKKGAFKGCKKKIKVSGGSKKVKKANVKKLKKSGYKKFK